MAMQRASPTRITPVRYAGRSGNINQASANITAGPMIQLRISDTAIMRRSAVILPISR